MLSVVSWAPSMGGTAGDRPLYAWVVVTLPDPVGFVRNSMGGAVRQVLAGRSTRTPEDFVQDGSDVGLFGPDSVTWRVHGTPAMVIGGLRALFLQTLHPLAMAGVAEHSDFRNDPLGRLHRTSDFVGVTTYGTTARADDAIAMVQRVHTRVQGLAPDGRPYSASDPHLVTWVHVTEISSFLAAYRRYAAGPALSQAEADKYIAEMAVIAVRLGADADDVPHSEADLRAWIKAVRPELRYSGQAQATVRYLLLPPLPLMARGPYGVVAAAALGLLPPWARRMVWLPPIAVADPIVVRPAATAMIRSLSWLLGPPPTIATAESRAAG